VGNDGTGLFRRAFYDSIHGGIFIVSPNFTTDNAYFYRVGAAGDPPATVNLTATPSTVDEGGSTTLNWTTTNATSCIASDDWGGVKGTSGSEPINNITSNSSYTLTCNAVGEGLDGVDTAVVTVNDPNPPPTVTLNADETSVFEGDNVLLTYTISNATSCNGSSAPSSSFDGGITPQDGSQTVTNLQTDITFTLFCSNANDNAQDQVSVTVSEPLSYALYNDDDGNFGSGEVLLSNEGDLSGQIYVHVLPETDIVSVRYSVDGNNVGSTEGAAPYVLDGDDGYDSNLMSDGSHTITALVQTGSDTLTLTENVIINNSGGTIDPTLNVTLSPTSIEAGQSSLLSWDSTDATNCEGLSGVSGSLAADGNQTVNPTSTTIYEIRCTGNGGTVTDSATLTVTPPASTDNDNDGVSNDDEVTNGTDPNDPDTDNDGLDDGEEITYNTDPLDPDSDNDGSTDGAEVNAGSNPNDPNDTPSTTTDDDSGGGATGLWLLWWLNGVLFIRRKLRLNE
ncbi:MAG: hypothetical protein HKM24_01950, partial [Gammaproteobacteria bacterium]|nr:hypothetical protein [Gammaproteobacteria bacterium]